MKKAGNGQVVDESEGLFHNSMMSIDSTVDLVHDLQKTLERAASGVRDQNEMRQARYEMNRMRDELLQKIGVVDVAVDLIRDARNQ